MTSTTTTVHVFCNFYSEKLLQTKDQIMKKSTKECQKLTFFKSTIIRLKKKKKTMVSVAVIEFPAVYN